MNSLYAESPSPARKVSCYVHSASLVPSSDALWNWDSAPVPAVTRCEGVSLRRPRPHARAPCCRVTSRRPCTHGQLSLSGVLLHLGGLICPPVGLSDVLPFPASCVATSTPLPHTCAGAAAPTFLPSPCPRSRGGTAASPDPLRSCTVLGGSEADTAACPCVVRAPPPAGEEAFILPATPPAPPPQRLPVLLLEAFQPLSTGFGFH